MRSVGWGRACHVKSREELYRWKDKHECPGVETNLAQFKYRHEDSVASDERNVNK